MDYNLKFAFAIVFLLVFGVALQSGHCATSAPHRHDNGLGPVIEYTNPYTYMFGAIVNVPENPNRVFQDDKGKIATIITIQPAYAFELYTDELVFCGNEAAALKGMTGPIVLAYKTVAHKLVGGVACHELQGVYHVTAESEEGQ